MQFENLGDALLLTPRVFTDERGFFFESWNQQSFNELLSANSQSVVEFLQDNHSHSCRGVLRGLHYQLPPHAQGKLVRCVDGEIYDVAIDLRSSSRGFGQWNGLILSAANHKQLWVPPGFAHGFLTISEHAEVLYKTTDFWNRNSERAIRWDDPKLAINWPLEKLQGARVQLSEKDAASPLFAALQEADLF